MKLELLAEGYMFLEAPRMDAAGNLYFTDNHAGLILCRARDGKIATLLTNRHAVGGMAVNADGRLIISGFDGLSLLNPNTGKLEVLMDKVDGVPIGAINDIQPDGDGGLYAGLVDAGPKKLKTAEAWARAQAQPLVLLTPDRKARAVAHGIMVSNGIGLSPNRRTVYQVETMKGILAYDRAPDGSLSNGRLAVVHPLSDGLTVDSEGGIWIGAIQGKAIIRFTPDGKMDRRIEMPVKEVTSLTFGGDDLRDIYVTTGSDINKPNYERTGRVYRLRSDVAGQRTPVTRF